MRILYLTANAQLAKPPKDIAKGPQKVKKYDSLNLWPELERVTNALFDARCEGRVALEVVPEVKPSDLTRYLGKQAVDVLHFSGHGDKDRPLDARLDGETEHRLILKEAGFRGIAGRYVANDWLRDQLEGKGIKLLVLNCCWSTGVADKLSGVADCIIGTTIALRGDLAADFSELLYGSLEKGLTLGEIKDLLQEQERFNKLYTFHTKNDNVLASRIAPIPEDERQMTPAREILAKRDKFLTMRSSIGWRASVEALKLIVAVEVALICVFVLPIFVQHLPGYRDWMAYEPAAIIAAFAGNPVARIIGFITVWIGSTTMNEMLQALSLQSPNKIKRELATPRVDEIFNWLDQCFDRKIQLKESTNA